MNENGLSIADALAIARGNDNDGFGGGNGFWWIILLVLFFGWGGNGNWGMGGNNACCTPATAQGMSDAFNFSALNQGITSTHDSVVDGFYQNNLATTNLGTAMQTGFAGVNMNTTQTGYGIQSSLCNGFNNVLGAIANSNYQRAQCCCETRESIMQSNFNNQAGFNNVVNSLATNACDIERGQDDIKYLMAQNQSQTMVSIDKLGDRLIDYMNQNKMDELRTELQNARFQISQANQTEQILNQLQPISRPAYITASPYQSLNYNGVNGCGCGNF